MKDFRVLLVTLSVAVAALGCRYNDEVLAGQANRESQVWVTDLRKVGYRSSELSPDEQPEATRRITFGSREDLVVVGGETSFSRPGMVRAFVIDAKAGSLLRESNWTANGWAYIFGTAKGEFAVNTDQGLVLYGPGLSGILARNDHTTDMASPDGLSFVVRENLPERGEVVVTLDSGTLGSTDVEFRTKSFDSFAQDRIVYTVWIDGSTNATVVVEDSHGAVERYETTCRRVRPYFVSKTHLAVLGCDQVEVIEAGGPRVFSYSSKGDCSFAGASRDGKRFSIVEAFYGSGHEPGLRTERFTVFDVNSRSPIFRVDIKELRGRKRGRSGAALSPDGGLLAVNSLGMVKLFSLENIKQ